MKTFTIGNLKGGVAKSTSTVNTAYSFSLLGKRVLVIDLDPQCNTTRFFAKVNKSGCSIQDVLLDASKIKKAVRRTQYKNIDIVKGCSELNESVYYSVVPVMAQKLVEANCGYLKEETAEPEGAVK